MKEKFSIAFGLLLLGGVGYLIYKVATWLVAILPNIEPTVGAAMVAAAATVVSSVFIASYNSRKARERVAFQAHREKKAEIYNEFMEMVVEIMRKTKEGKEGSEVLPDNVVEFFYRFTSKVTVYGGPGVVRAFGKWRSASTESQNPNDSLLVMDSLFREMRADLGESNTGINQYELLGLFIIGGQSEIAKQAKNAIQRDTEKKSG
jgi:hypothetical protein